MGQLLEVKIISDRM